MTTIRRYLPLLAAIITASPAFADDAPKDVAIQHYAETMHIGTFEAAQRMDAERAAGKLSARLQREKPETFAGLYIEHSPEFRIIVKFTGDASGQLSAYTKDRLYVAENSPRSLELLRATQAEVSEQLVKAGIEFAATVDIKNSIVEVYVRDPDAVRARLSNLLSVVDFIRVKETTGFIEPTNTVAGGRRLEGYQQQLCTAGFNVVETATRELGLATAGHCDNDNYQRNPTARILFKSERNKGSYDVQWGAQQRGGVIFSQSNEIIVDGEKLAITDEASLADMTPGTTVCKFGVTTGRTCGSIKDAEFAANWKGEAGTYVQVVSLDGTVMNKGGDSGGPVYAGNSAYGLVHGRGNDGSPWENDLFFMPIERMSTLGVATLTKPFQLDSVPNVSGTGASVTATMNFSGYPRFPVYVNLEVVTCPAGWICIGGRAKVDKNIPSPITFTWGCTPSKPGEPQVSRVRTFLEDASGLVTQAIESTITCTTPTSPAHSQPAV